MSEPKYAYMDRVDYDHELEGRYRGTTLYPDMKALRAAKRCVREGACTAVRVRVEIEEVTQQGSEL